MDGVQPSSPVTSHALSSDVEFEGESLAIAVRTLVENTKTFARVPSDLYDEWIAVKDAQQGETSPGRVFLDEGGFRGWLAYNCLVRVTTQTSNFTGKAECKRLLTELDRPDTSIGYLQQVAKGVATSFTGERERDIEQFRHSKRRRTSPPKPSHSFATPGVASASTAVGQTIDPPTPDFGGVSTRGQGQPTLPYDDLHLVHDDSVLINPDLDASRNLFPAELSDAIATNPHPTEENMLVGAISMSFPVEGSSLDVCQLSLQIRHEKVAYFANKWFGYYLEAIDGLRYTVSPTGSSIVPYPRFTIRGIPRAILLAEFGQEVSYAIQRSPRCLEDARRVRTHTDSVSMIVFAQEQERAQVVLSLGLVEGTQIKDKLFY
ncbi:hypothetical protein CEP54_000284 [Fusarium duplospermum]|uniref:Uncharacterized protein n=1 Tax=Fusarium duplospermum TaxID=1325734 RepID=A0A428R8B8_9HYPO|nr:hypothetical protein CEP54_000284 [Fusarium duplospermum]